MSTATLGFACPTCASAIGDACTTKSGNPATKPHIARVRAEREADAAATAAAAIRPEAERRVGLAVGYAEAAANAAEEPAAAAKATLRMLGGPEYSTLRDDPSFHLPPGEANWHEFFDACEMFAPVYGVPVSAVKRMRNSAMASGMGALATGGTSAKRDTAWASAGLPDDATVVPCEGFAERRTYRTGRRGRVADAVGTGNPVSALQAKGCRPKDIARLVVKNLVRVILPGGNAWSVPAGLWANL